MIGYFVQVRTLNGPWITVNERLITGTAARVKRLHPGTEYEFRVTALNDNGLGEYSSTSDPVVPFTENRPRQPGRPVATVTGTSVNLQWSMSDNEQETEHLRYVIHGRETVAERTVMYACTERKAGPTISHTLSNVRLNSETQYQFAVAACNEARLGLFSSYSQPHTTLSG